MFKAILITMFIAQIALAQYEIIDRYNELKFKHLNKFLDRTRARTNKLFPGGYWVEADPVLFQTQHEDVVAGATQAVEAQYNPFADGYNFTNVSEISTQYVNGHNYVVVTDYMNLGKEVRKYETIIYTASTARPYQVVSSKVRMGYFLEKIKIQY